MQKIGKKKPLNEEYLKELSSLAFAELQEPATVKVSEKLKALELLGKNLLAVKEEKAEKEGEKPFEVKIKTVE